MSISGILLRVNDYGLELDSFLGAIYLPWHSIVFIAVSVIGYRFYKRKAN